jgi:hypothetical protein
VGICEHGNERAGSTRAKNASQAELVSIAEKKSCAIQLF